jgi:hypothetical protein
MLKLTRAGFGTIRASIQGPAVVLEGTVASFEAKCKIEEIATKAGLRVHNHLRVTPAAFNAVPALEMP